MAVRKEKMKVVDSANYHYEVDIEHSPQLGLSVAKYYGHIIATVEYGRITEPAGDDDRDWERYEELFDNWSCDAKSDLYPKCKDYFDSQTK